MGLFEDMVAMANAGVKQRKHPSEREHNLQVACVRWLKLQYPQFAHNLFAVPNGGKRDKVTAGKMKAEGVLAGVSDLIFLKSNANFGALLIEMKDEKGKQSEAQKEWQKLIEADGYKYVVCRSLEDFMREIKDYIETAF